MDNKKKQNEFLTRIMRDIEDVTPTPKWQFLAKRWLLVSAFVCSMVLGALTVTGIIFSFANVGFAYYRLTHDTLFGFIVEAAPFLWIISTLLLLASAYVTFKNTEGGYKYPALQIIGVVTLGSIVIGFLLFTVGVGQILENQTRKFSPIHSPLERIEGKWNAPEQGRLAGVILSIQKGAFIMEDTAGEEWNVVSTELEEGSIRILSVDKRFRILGVYSNNTFTACIILPWDIQGQVEGPQRFEQRSKQFGERKVGPPRISTCEEVRSHTPLPPRRTQ